MTLKKILLLPGDGIGPEVIAQAEKVLMALNGEGGLSFELECALLGGSAIDACGPPLPGETLALASAGDGFVCGNLDRALRPEQGLLGIRSALGVFANLRPAILHPKLADASTLKPEVVSDLDILIQPGQRTDGRIVP